MQFTPLEKIILKSQVGRYRASAVRNKFSNGVRENSLTGFNSLSLKDRLIFDKFLSCKQHSLSAYAFENIFIWKGIYSIFWAKINNNLCVFFKDRIGCFLYLPPLGKDLNADVVSECFKVMDQYNKNKIISRIENVEEKRLSFYKDLGYEAVLGGSDYICKREILLSLKGNAFKKKRSAINYFTKNYSFKYQPYTDTDKRDSITLYQLWMRERKAKNQDTIYQKLLEDNFTIFKTALDYYKRLKFVGRVIKIAKEIKALTFGYRLGSKGFVVLFEVCDLRLKGIAQYIFREFCRELDYKEINIMDDSGLDNLKRVKLSYRPDRIENNFIIRYG